MHRNLKKSWSNVCHLLIYAILTILFCSARLFHFFHGHAEIHGRIPKLSKTTPEGSVVTVEVGDGLVPNDLVSRLSAVLSTFTETGSTHDVIFEPSQLVMFHLKATRNNPSTTLPNTAKSTSDVFIYPKYLYLDQFLVENLRLANEKRALEREMSAEIEALARKREFLTRYNVGFTFHCLFLPAILILFQNRDTLRDLQASLYYYENIAESKEDPVRQEAIAATAKKLRNILETVTSRVDGKLAFS